MNMDPFLHDLIYTHGIGRLARDVVLNPHLYTFRKDGQDLVVTSPTTPSYIYVLSGKDLQHFNEQKRRAEEEKTRGLYG